MRRCVRGCAGLVTIDPRTWDHWHGISALRGGSGRRRRAQLWHGRATASDPEAAWGRRRRQPLAQLFASTPWSSRMTLRQALAHLRHSRRGGDAGNHAQVALDLRAKASLATIDPRARAVIATTFRSTRLTRERVLWHSPRPILQRYGIIPKGSRWHSFSVQGDSPGKRRCAKRWHNCATHRRAVLQQYLPYRRSAAGHHTRPRRRAREDKGHDTIVCKIHGSIGRAVAEFMAKALSGSEGDATGIVAAATFTECPPLAILRGL